MAYTESESRSILQGMEGSETRNILLPNGGTLHVTMTDQFIVALRNHFKLAADERIEDDHIRMFIFGAVKGALDKAEAESQ